MHNAVMFLMKNDRATHVEPGIHYFFGMHHTCLQSIVYHDY